MEEEGDSVLDEILIVLSRASLSHSLDLVLSEMKFSHSRIELSYLVLKSGKNV